MTQYPIKPYVLPSHYHEHVSEEVWELLGKGEPITITQWEALRLNTYERLLLHPLLDDEALLETVGLFLHHCSRTSIVPHTYDQTLAVSLVPILCARLRQHTETKHDDSLDRNPGRGGEAT